MSENQILVFKPKEKPPIVFPKDVLYLISLLENAGHEAWAVGGCVRDSLSSRDPNDWDLCTSASPEEMKKALSGLKVLQTGEKHGTLTAVLSGSPYEITTYRADGEYENHRRPRQVEYVSDISFDLSRRDFTINAMAAHPHRGVLDLFGGQEDLKKGVIRCVGEPLRRFEEDALRILRALRFAARFGFEIEENTLWAMYELSPLMTCLSAERIYSEVSRLILAPHAGEILTRHGEILSAICPELDLTFAARLASAPKGEAALRFSLLFENAQAARKTLTRLRAPKKVLERVVLLLSQTEPPQSDDIWIRKALSRMGSEALWQYFILTSFRSTLPQECTDALLRVLLRGDAFEVSMLAISGTELVSSGICPKGPLCGRILKALLDGVMEGEYENTPPALMRAAKLLAMKMRMF